MHSESSFMLHLLTLCNSFVTYVLVKSGIDRYDSLQIKQT
uniref:Uncharacterized protein n=1 Tax=Arundo donax TaxID=35708 RepID=A0A0A9B5U1_ARUDO